MERLLKGLGIGLMLFMLAGCQTMTGETAGQNLDDASVTASVKTQHIGFQSTLPSSGLVGISPSFPT